MVPRVSFTPEVYSQITNMNSRVMEFQPIANTLQGVAKIPSHGLPDPFNDYRMWYFGASFGEEFRVTDLDINNKLWDYTEFRKFVDGVNGNVLLQREGDMSSNVNGWRLAFSDPRSLVEVRDWFRSLVKNYRIETTMTSDQHTEMEVWVNERIRGPHVVTGGWSNQLRNVVAVIKDPNEAMEFKMRWYKIAPPEEESA
jgi:hypothetical protein